MWLIARLRVPLVAGLRMSPVTGLRMPSVSGLRMHPVSGLRMSPISGLRMHLLSVGTATRRLMERPLPVSGYHVSSLPVLALNNVTADSDAHNGRESLGQFIFVSKRRGRAKGSNGDRGGSDGCNKSAVHDSDPFRLVTCESVQERDSAALADYLGTGGTDRQ